MKVKFILNNPVYALHNVASSLNSATPVLLAATVALSMKTPTA
jgi:hypothetical protein